MTHVEMARDMNGKVALITGGASGIGRAAADAFAARGASVVIADVSDEHGAAAVADIRAGGGSALYVRCDVSRATDVEALVATTVHVFGRLDCAFNNAGVMAAFGVEFAEASEEEWDRLIAVNLKGVWLCMKYEIRQMLAQGGGSIVNTASVAGLKGTLGPASYAAAKHGVVGLTRTAALHYAGRGIRVNAVCPGVTATPMVEDMASRVPDYAASRQAMIPMGRFGTSEEIAEAAVWLSSDAASYVTGLAMQVDGGWFAK